MDAVGKLVAELGLAPETIEIRGEQGYRLKETKRTVSDHLADHYETHCVSLTLSGPGVEAPLEPGTPEFEELAKALNTFVKLPLHSMLLEAGSPPPDERRSFKASYVLLHRLKRLDDEWFDALINDDRGKLAEIDWERFQMTPSFRKRPCDRETHDLLRPAYTSSRYAVGMEFGHYYDWFKSSEAELGDDGAPNAETAAKAVGLIEGWKASMSAEQVKQWLCRNLRIHPLHRAPFEDMVDAAMAENGASPARHGP
jgi:hypothetical protein